MGGSSCMSCMDKKSKNKVIQDPNTEKNANEQDKRALIKD